MNIRTIRNPVRATLIAVAVSSALLTACASKPPVSDGPAQARARLTQLQSDSRLASLAPVAMNEAGDAVTLAEKPEKDAVLVAHRVYLADRKVSTAAALAETKFAEDQRTTLTEQRERARLDARTREADKAKADADVAKVNAELANAAATAARNDGDAARLSAERSEQANLALQAQIEALQAKVTERGLVLTLGDVLFASGRAELRSSASANLGRLTTFLNTYPERTAVIEGYTDDVGTEDANQGLSQRRADSVRSYLVGQGVGMQRLVAVGKGESSPVADNTSDSGRQQNRRVEIIIAEPVAAAAAVRTP
jgi:outer membrane protein OmpA-like peptidoglycan-associated protein